MKLYIYVIITVVFCSVYAAYMGSAISDCKKRGGVLVRGGFLYECVQPK